MAKNTARTDRTDAWTTFWQRQDERGKTGGGCVPEGWRGIARRQRQVWHSFARSLPRRARVLDLATGDGAVLKHLAEARPDLDLTGVDRADAIPQAPRGMVLKGGVSMEDLPFPDDSFAAVTSQFGFEYGDIAEVAEEAARVLEPGGRMGLLVHRETGPIVAHNRKRREQIDWAIEQENLLEAARDYVGIRDTVDGGIPGSIAKAPQAGASQFGEGSAAWEIAEAVRQTLVMGAADSAENVAAIIGDIEAQAQNELGRIASLESAAATASDEDRFVDTLEAAGFALASDAMVSDGVHPAPFADYRTFTLKD